MEKKEAMETPLVGNLQDPTTENLILSFREESRNRAIDAINSRVRTMLEGMPISATS